MTPTQKSRAQRLAEEHREKLAEKIAVTGDFIEFDDVEDAYVKGYTAAEERAEKFMETLVVRIMETIGNALKDWEGGK